LVAAKAAILMDRQTGLVLWSYNADTELPMASTTKIMTAMVIIDHGSDQLDQLVTVSQHAAATGGSSLLAAGDMLSLHDLLVSALLRSSNEATVAAAEYLTGGNVQRFVDWMNEKAKNLGLSHTHFVNPHGLFDHKMGAQHYTTARELAIITRYALTDYPLIRQIVASKHLVVNIAPRGTIRLDNHNKILGDEVPGCAAEVDGVKTGFVNQSGKCLVSSATLDGWQIIAVVLGGNESYFQESLSLLHSGFSHFQWQTYATRQQAGCSVPILWGTGGEIPVGVRGVLGAPIPRPESGAQVEDHVEFRGKRLDTRLTAPVKDGDEIGTLVLVRNGQDIAVAPAIALRTVPVAWWVRVLHVLLCCLYCSLAAVAFVVGVRIYGKTTKAHRRRRRQLATARRDVDHGRTSYGQ
jgi:D-alanyl-D-alanine carboxypeptidase (penicillin-binding protein 5/6)